MRKSATRYIPTAKSVAFKAEMALGSRLVEALPVKMTLEEAGKKMGISHTMVSRIERRALAKIAMALREHARKIGYLNYE